MSTNDPVDVWLDDAMKTEIDSAVGTDAPPPPRYRNSTTARRLRLAGLTTIPLALSFRLVTALAAGGLAAAGGTAVLVSSHTPGTSGSTQPVHIVVSSASAHAAASNHGSVVTSAVALCKAARPSPHASPKPSPGSRGIGSCVSIVASGGRSKGADTGGSDTKPSHPTPKPHPSSGS
jgi:hypothetical protein